MLAKSMDRARAGHRYRPTAFAFMPEDMHWTIHPPRDAGTIKALFKEIKRLFSYRIQQQHIESEARVQERFRIRQCLGVMMLRHWQEGAGRETHGPKRRCHTSRYGHARVP